VSGQKAETYHHTRFGQKLDPHTIWAETYPHTRFGQKPTLTHDLGRNIPSHTIWAETGSTHDLGRNWIHTRFGQKHTLAHDSGRNNNYRIYRNYNFSTDFTHTHKITSNSTAHQLPLLNIHTQNGPLQANAATLSIYTYHHQP